MQRRFNQEVSAGVEWNGCLANLWRRQDLHDIPYTSRYDVEVDLPKYQLPEQGVDSKVAYQLLHDELMLGMSIPAVSALCGLFG